MSNKLGSLIAMIGAGMGGYAKGVQVRRDADRQDKAEARADEEYQYQQGERAKAQKLEGDVSAAMANRDVETVTPPDMSNADVSLAGPQPTQYKVGDQSYADEGAARAALLGTNSRAAKFQRAADAAATSGTMAGVDRSLAFEALAKKAKAEGADQVLTHIQKAQPSLADLKKAGGTMAGSIAPEAADVFNTTGSEWKLGPDAQVVHYVDKDSAGREFVNSRVLDKDGKPLLNDVHHAGLFLQDFKTRQEAQDNDTRTFQTGQQIAQAGDRDKESTRHNKAEEGIQAKSAATAAAHLGIAQQSLKLQQQAAFAATPAGQIAALEKANGGPLTADQKMEKLGLSRISKPDQMVVASVLKSQEQLDQARAKAMAEGTYQPDSPGAKELAAQSAVNSLKLNQVLGKYNTAKDANPDPLGIFGGSGAGTVPNPFGPGQAPARMAAQAGTAAPAGKGAPAGPVAGPSGARGFNEMTPAEREARYQARHAAQAGATQQQAAAQAEQARASQAAAVQDGIAKLEAAQKQGRLLDPSQLNEMRRQLAQLQAR